MPDDTLIRDLVAAGLDASLVARVEQIQQALTHRKAKDAERQRRAYAKQHKPHVTSRESHVRSREVACRLPKDWQPSTADLDFGVSLGFSQRELATIAETFRDYWHSAAGKNATKREWSAAWRNWLRRNNEQRRPQHNGVIINANGSIHNESPTQLARRLAEECRQLELKAGVGRPRNTL